MTVSRRSFVASAASIAAAAAATPIGALGGGTAAPVGGDPLGVRGDFPVVRDRIYLNSAYITPVPRSVVAAGRRSSRASRCGLFRWATC